MKASLAALASLGAGMFGLIPLYLSNEANEAINLTN